MKNKENLVIISGYFNPLHVGHIEYINSSKKLGDKLIVIINSDLQRKLKGSKVFMNEQERRVIINNIKSVDLSIISIDKDRSVTNTIKLIHEKYNHKYDLIFTNGGDQFFDNSPEKNICKKLNVKIVDGLGEKIQSSSKLLKDYGHDY